MSDKFTKKFTLYLAAFWSVVGAAFVFTVLFAPIPENNVRFADTVLGFLLGTVIASLINFFFGSSQGSSEKTELLSKSKNENP